MAKTLAEMFQTEEVEDKLIECFFPVFNETCSVIPTCWCLSTFDEAS